MKKIMEFTGVFVLCLALGTLFAKALDKKCGTVVKEVKRPGYNMVLTERGDLFILYYIDPVSRDILGKSIWRKDHKPMKNGLKVKHEPTQRLFTIDPSLRLVMRS